MANQYTDAAFETQLVSGVTKAVLLALAYFTGNENGICWPSIATICRVSGWGRSAVKIALKELTEAGIVEIVGTKQAKNGLVHIWKINQSALQPSRETTQLRDNPVTRRPSTRAGDNPVPGCNTAQYQVARRPQNSVGNSEENSQEKLGSSESPSAEAKQEDKPKKTSAFDIED